MSPSISAVAGMSFFAYALMAVIAMTTAAMIAALVAGLAALGRRAAASAPVTAAATRAPATPAAATPPMIAGEIDPAVIAAIAAAVRMTVGDHRIVWIGEAQPMGGWTSEVRQRHHAQHHPHPSH